MYVFTYIYPISRVHNTSLVSAYFGVDKRECYCLENLINLYIILQRINITSLMSRNIAFTKDTLKVNSASDNDKLRASYFIIFKFMM
jgi:hypothetical protein